MDNLCRRNLDNPEVHKIIISTISEVNKMFTSDSDQDHEVSKMITSSAQNDRFGPPYMHVNDHACMDDEINQLKDDLNDIGFDQPGRWLQKENVSWELVSDWLEYVNSNGGIRNKAGFVRRQVEAGEKPNLVKARRRSIPAEYEGLFKR